MKTKPAPIKLPRIPNEIISLEKVRDLIYCDGPLLSEYKSKSGETYLYLWSGVEENSHNNWLLFRVTKRDLLRYLLGKITLLDLVRNLQGGMAYVVEIDCDLNKKAIYFVPKDEIPQDFLPGEESNYDPIMSGVEG